MKEVTVSTKYTCDGCGKTATVKGDDGQQPDGWKSVRLTENNAGVALECQACPDCDIPIEATLTSFKARVAEAEAARVQREEERAAAEAEEEPAQ